MTGAFCLVAFFPSRLRATVHLNNDPLNDTKQHEMALVSFRVISWIESFFFLVAVLAAI